MKLLSRRAEIALSPADDFEPVHATAPAAFAARVREFGDRVALRRKEFGLWREFTWRDYDRQVRACFHGLAALGARERECVALIAENRPEWLFIDLAVLHLRGITAAIYVTSAADQVEYIVDHCEARFFFVENEEQLDKWYEFRARAPRVEKVIVLDREGLRHVTDSQVMFFDDFLELGRAHEAQHPELFGRASESVEPGDTAIIVYTSGTTGPPKGAMLTHHNLMWTCASLGRANPIHAGDEVLSFLPLCHIAERVMSTFNQLSFGYTVNFAERLDTVPQNLREISPTVFFAVPRIWEKFHSRVKIGMREAAWFNRIAYGIALRAGRRHAEAVLKNGGASVGVRLAFALAHVAVFHPLKKRLGLERVRFALSGAAPISPEVLAFFHAMGLWVREVYGQTEGSGPATIHYADRIKPGTVGRPIPGCDVKIAPDGEILVRGGNVFAGYYKNPQATRDALADGWLASGDVGEFDDEGFLRITDRKKDIIINSAGKNIAPQNIENRLKASPYIQDAVAIGDRRPYVTALVLIDEEHVVKFAQDERIPFTTYASLARHERIRDLIQTEVDEVNRHLARVEQIKTFAILDKRLDQEDGELTPTMKVKRKKINEIYRDVIEALYR